MRATVCLPQLDWMVRRRAMILPIPNELLAIYLLSLRNGSPEITISGHSCRLQIVLRLQFSQYEL